MQVTRKTLEDASAQGLLRPDQCEPLWSYLAVHGQDTPTFKPAHILYYLGGMIAIGAMTLFVTLGWERFGGTGLLVVASGGAGMAIALTETLLRGRHLALPAGIAAVLAVALVPLALYGAQHALGLWPADGAGNGAYRDFHTRIDGRWFVMELGTLAAGVAALWRWRLPFLVMPVAVTLWYMSMDLVPLLLGGAPGEFFSDRGKRISMGFGFAMTLIAVWVDLRSGPRHDFAFWLYLFGVLAFWGGLTGLDSNSELGKLLYCGINLLLIAVGAALSRRVFAVFGGIGVALYLGHLSYTIFKDSLLFPFALAAIGLMVVAAGIFWQRHERAIQARLHALLPGPVRTLVERRATH